MDNGFYNDYDDRLIGSGTSDDDEEELDGMAEESEEIKESDPDEEYYELPLAIKSRSLIWSVISFVAGVLSLALCPFYYVSLIFAVGSVVTSMISRRNLGFFEKYAVVGLILGIMGFVFGIFSAIAKSIGIFG